MEAWDAIHETSGGRLEPYAATAGVYNPNIAAAMASMPVTLEHIAKMHGAETPADAKRFIELTVALNGPRLEQAQQKFVDFARRMNPAFRPVTLPIEQRPFVAGDSDVVLPAYFLQDGSALSGHDHGSLRDWKADVTAGQFWFQEGRRTIVYHEKHLTKDDPGYSTTRHEFGHAYESALRKLDPAFYRTFKTRWNAAYWTNFRQIQEHRFPTGYAATNPGEFFAESFSVHFGGHRATVEPRDPQAAGLMGEALERAPSMR